MRRRASSAVAAPARPSGGRAPPRAPRRGGRGRSRTRSSPRRSCEASHDGDAARRPTPPRRNGARAPRGRGDGSCASRAWRAAGSAKTIAAIRARSTRPSGPRTAVAEELPRGLGPGAARRGRARARSRRRRRPRRRGPRASRATVDLPGGEAARQADAQHRRISGCPGAFDDLAALHDPVDLRREPATSARGSPATATRSAKAPFSIDADLAGQAEQLGGVGRGACGSPRSASCRA